jgi:hypothetical protein
VFECLAQLETNGRDIRNFTRTSEGYARSTGDDLALGHVIPSSRRRPDFYRAYLRFLQRAGREKIGGKHP